MRGLIICCLVALAACQSVRYGVSLNPKKTYQYKYDGLVNFGLGMPDLAESGVKMSCKVNISGVSAQMFTLTVSDLAFQEFNGFPAKDGFIPSPKLTQRISSQLSKPFLFDYTSGHIGDIKASTEVSETVVNIVRGILDFFQVTVKSTQKFYELEEIGIYGKCQSTYAVEELQNDELKLTREVDVNNCEEKAAVYQGMATAVLDKTSQQRGESIVSTVTYVYTVKPTAEGGLIKAAHSLERQHFSPFNVKGGSFKMQATKKLELFSEEALAEEATIGPMESRGDLVYKFINAEDKVPIMMQDLTDPVPKAMELIKRLAAANNHTIDSSTTEDTVKLFQLLRVTPYEGLEETWKQLRENPEDRRWFLDTIVEIGDARILKFLEKRFQARDISVNEALQTFLVAINHLKTDQELVEMAKMFLNVPFSKSDVYLWHTVVLTYGSLVYKHCAYNTACPVSVVQPLLDMAVDALKNGIHEDQVLVLKALGNAGHPGSIKTIKRFLPGVAANPVDLPPRVQSAAVQSMRLIAARDPHSVQEITMSLFLQKNLPTEIRMLALMMLFDTKPSMALVSMVTGHLMEEKDLHVGSFAYSYLKSFARSKTPDNHFLSTACNIAMKILAPKFGRLSYSYSQARRMDWFNDDFLIGTAGEVFMLGNATNIFPTEFMTKGKLYVIGRILQLMEFGFRAETVQQLFGSSIPGFKGDFSFSDLQAVFSVLKNWEVLPEDQPVLSAFTRASGQEWFFADINKSLIRSVVKALNVSAGKDTPLWMMMENLQKGYSWRWTKPFLIFEARYFQATTLGLPLEISKYYQSVTGVSVNAKAGINPPPTEHLGQLLKSEISLDSDGFIGFTKDFWMFYGINTEFFQSGSEFITKIPVSAPWKFTAKINAAQKKYEFDFPLCNKEIEFFSVSSNVYAVSRNIEEPILAKMTPMIPDITVSNDQIQTANIWRPKTNSCVESQIYGAGLCVESEIRRQYYNEEYPLFYFLGYTQMAIKLGPVKANRDVDKIHLEVNAGPSTHPMNARQLLETLRRLSQDAAQKVGVSSDSATRGTRRSPRDAATDGLDSTPEAMFNVKLFALSGNQKPEGFDAVMYNASEGNSRNAELIVSQVGEDVNWKVCVDAAMSNGAEAKVHISWGSECQSYEMWMEAAAVNPPGSKPAFNGTLRWSRIPDYLEEYGSRIESYVPSMALLFGFYQENQENVQREVSASVVAASAHSFDVKIRFPKYTVYRQAVPFPLLASSSFHASGTQK
ncbi:vitellogenin 3, phosvitinless [Amphiprion ocellaris]|uniref:Vitellogenin domain-containing protein n=1 Tax=Amphiprion ocellaris TaxID=80972 RepID=A0A3Q1BX79_AMPOC|nr:vitellogenin 3, phosvitinless [Amphiprion ocellaris]XP_054871255.1 vitellogenin 3, phosvitinless [Amphiprion ocellaris]